MPLIYEDCYQPFLPEFNIQAPFQQTLLKQIRQIHPISEKYPALYILPDTSDIEPQELNRIL